MAERCAADLSFEAMNEAFAVDVEPDENFEDVFFGDMPVLRPEQDVKVFLAGDDAIKNAFEEKGFFFEVSLHQAKVAAVEFGPEGFA